MEQFKIRQDGFREIRKAMIIRLIPVMLLAAFGGLAISYFRISASENDVNIFPTLVPLMLGAMSIGVYVSIKRQRKMMDSYTLTIDETSITREQYNTPSITLLYNDVREIIKNADGSFMIKGNSSIDMIVIPSQMDNYQQLEEMLVGIHPISERKKVPFLQKYRLLFSVLAIGLMMGVYVSENKIVVGACGTVMLLFMGYSFFVLQKNKNVDNKTKNGSWSLILVAASVIGIMYYKLTGKM